MVELIEYFELHFPVLVRTLYAARSLWSCSRVRVFQCCLLNFTPSLVNPRLALINWKRKTVLMFQLLLFILLCILSGDIELNLEVAMFVVLQADPIRMKLNALHVYNGVTANVII